MSLPSLDDLERIKVISSVDLPSELGIGGATWLQVDRIRMRDEESEQKHEVAWQDTLDLYSRRDALKYPDGTKLQELGRAQCGGSMTFVVRRLRPGRPLLIVRRMDYVFDAVLKYEVDGVPAGVCEQIGTDRVHRFRNWPFVVAGELITGTEATIKQIAWQGKDISMYRFWFYQPMSGSDDDRG